MVPNTETKKTKKQNKQKKTHHPEPKEKDSSKIRNEKNRMHRKVCIQT